ASICFMDHVFAREVAVIGNVEEVSKFCAHAYLTSFFDQRLSEDDEPVSASGLRRLVLELGDVLGLQGDVVVSALEYDLILDTRLLGASFRFEDGVGLPDKLPILIVIDGLSLADHRLTRVVAKDESYIEVGPAVEMSGEGEVAVASQEDVLKARTPTPVDGSVEYLGRMLMRRTISRTIDDEERLPCIGQRNEERVIAPDSFVREVHALLAGSLRRDHGSVRIDSGRLLDELLAESPPNAEASFVDGRHQSPVCLTVEAAAEVTRCRRIGNRTSTKCIEVAGIVPTKLDVVENLPTAQYIVCDVQDMVRLVIWPILLE